MDICHDIDQKKNELYGAEPYCEQNCYETDREECWHLCGCREGFDDGVKFTASQITQYIKDYGRTYMSGGEMDFDSLIYDINMKINIAK